MYCVQKFDNYNLLSIQSRCSKFRFVVERTWDLQKPKIAFIGLNPEHSTLTYWDNTLLICKEFAMHLGEGKYGGIYLLNLYPLICETTKMLLEYKGENFEKNLAYVLHCAKKSELIFCGWGDNVFRRSNQLMEHSQRALQMLEMLHQHSKIYCFDILKSGHPCSFIPRDSGFLLFSFLDSLKKGKKLEDYLYKIDCLRKK
ncbi:MULTISPECIES: DUF1643 domain-containing protein [unclassified Helicobacter]|uniref:DUF1643 domain-containing protein n=1 Tax=unclassified Helicobacter TaxID=2593540 RepID=UPI000CF1B082|nr:MULTISPECIES: DUF1643 domain-containing protein [unclassified Helicobacter]